jgi:Arc/MetJ-type ribon-helix-helix transcriptional regulator
MKSFNIAVPESTKEFIEGQVAKGKFRDPAEYILALVEADRTRRIRDDIERQLLEGLKSPAQLMPDAEWDEIRQLGEHLLAGKKQR